MFHNDSAEKRIAIFEDTMQFCRENSRLSDAVAQTISATQFYPAQLMPVFDKADCSGDTAVTVTKERTFESAKRLHSQYPDCRIAVLNFASATNPGGGVTRGSSAQEEALCRCSTLYPCLNTNELFGKFYKMHRNRKDLRYTDICIYTPDITVIKSDVAFPELLPETEWFNVDVITCAAPNLRKMPYNTMNPGSAEPIRVSDAELLKIHKKRGMRILNIAAANHADILILGAFGCGAFRNDPSIVARAYKEILPDYIGYFKAINFAVYCPPNDLSNYNVFRNMLDRA